MEPDRDPVPQKGKLIPGRLPVESITTGTFVYFFQRLEQKGSKGYMLVKFDTSCSESTCVR